MTTQRYQPPSSNEKKSRYDIVPTLGKNALLIFLSYSGHTNIVGCQGFVVAMVGTLVYRIFLITMNYAQTITFYHFFYESCLHPTKGATFSDS